MPAQGVDGVLAQEALPALADADRIDDQREFPAPQSGFHSLDDFRGKQHPRLGRGNGESVPYGLELEPHKAGLGGMDAEHAEAVLGRQRGDDAHAETADDGHGFEVGLNPRSAARVGTGDGQNARRRRHGKGSFG